MKKFGKYPIYFNTRVSRVFRKKIVIMEILEKIEKTVLWLENG